MSRLLALLSTLSLVACVDASEPEAPADFDISKDDAAAAVEGGKADWGFDVCHVMGWYGDDDCDHFCPTLDTDCELPRPAGLDLRDHYDIPGDTLFPESLGFDESRKQFAYGSLEKGNVSRLARDGRITQMFAGTGEAKRLTLGVKVDGPRDRIVVCSYHQVSPATGRVWIFDAATGARTHDIDLTLTAAGATCNDVVIDAAGDIFVSDRENPNVYKIRAGATGAATVTLWANHPLLAKATIGIGQNGIAFSEDGRALLVTKYLPAKLIRISVADPRDVREVQLSGDHPLPQLLAGADGMVRLGRDMYVTFGSSLIRLRSTDGWLTARRERFELGEKLAAVTVAQGQLYVLQSDIPQYVLPGSPAPFAIRRVDPRWFDL